MKTFLAALLIMFFVSCTSNSAEYNMSTLDHDTLKIDTTVMVIDSIKVDSVIGENPTK